MTKRTISRRGIFTLVVWLFSLIVVPYVAAQTAISVWIGPMPTDVCPNISGIQASPPAGMIIDTNGDCVTPTPPPVDVCGNIDGVQTTIPSGYYQDTNGDCVLQPTPPVDVCPNIYGLQTSVPSSLIVDSNGNCVTPAIDECPNIPGAQDVIPEGMVRESGECLTPPGTVSPPPAAPTVPQPAEYTPTTSPASNPRAYTGPDYKNVPDSLDPIIDPIVKTIPAPIRKFLQTVPQEVARTVPYYIIGVLGLVAGVIMFLAVRELFATRTLIILLKRDKDIADQKDNFIALASHYLRTPLTLMRNGLDTVVALKEVPVGHLEPLRKTVASLDANIKKILKDIENNDALKGIRNPVVKVEQTNVLRSAYFWVPILSGILLIWVANFLLGVVGNVDLGKSNMIFQGICLAAVIIVLYAAIRNHYIRRQHHARQEQLIANEHTVDTARNAFIQQSTTVLQQGLSDLRVLRPALENAPSARFFNEGYTRFSELLQKFLLLGHIQTGNAVSKELIDLHDLTNQVLHILEPAIEEKKLTITNDIPNGLTIMQNKLLFTFVLQSLIDNAIKFNNESGSVIIKASPSHKTIRVSIADNGIGIPADKLPQLFKPFSRAGSAIEFNYEGLGFSLFLDKIITDYMGGTIKATAPEKGGAKLTVVTSS